MKKAFFILISIHCFLIACKKQEPCGGNSYRYELESCLNSFMFDTGSYWVYSNISNGNVDSVFVVNCDYDTRGYKSGSGCGGSIGVFEYVNTEFQSTMFGQYATSMYEDMIAPEQLAPYEYRLFDCNQMVIVDTLHVTSQTFFNVQMIETINPSSKLYYKEDIGIVRKIVFDSIQDSTVFDLIDYQVVQFTLPD